MKIKEEQKEVIKAVTKKMGESLVEDMKSTEASSLKRPLVITLLVVAAVAISRDPAILVIGLLAAAVVLLVRSTSADDMKKLVNSLGKEKAEVKKEDKPEEKK